ncbi:hypothetical protein TIFTF001_005207 [Ficus carica]|uniref:Uncharacterized protein n=1 Tax=Ficus carica TaxID=3494 RepID=A0AA87ZN39_FICCA|nr:hypothetical protein TIFTF001_005207 [Ficus carica]
MKTLSIREGAATEKKVGGGRNAQRWHRGRGRKEWRAETHGGSAGEEGERNGWPKHTAVAWGQTVAVHVVFPLLPYPTSHVYAPTPPLSSVSSPPITLAFAGLEDQLVEALRLCSSLDLAT